MWIWIETAGSSAAGGAILFLAIAMLAVLFISPFAGVFIAIRSYKKRICGCLCILSGETGGTKISAENLLSLPICDIMW
jgi:hypothetical protein